MTKREALRVLAEDQGHGTVMELLEACACDGVNPGICMACGEVSDSMEPDQTEGYCDGCGENRVQAPLVLAGLI